MPMIQVYQNAWHRRAARRAAVALSAALLVFLAADRALSRAPATVSTSDASRVEFRVDLEPHLLRPGRVAGTTALTIPGFFAVGEPGQPATLTRQYLVALPPTGDYSVDWRVVASTPLGVMPLEPNPYPDGFRDDMLGPVTSERFAMEPEVYNAYTSPPTVEVREPVFIRKNRALPLFVNPVTFDPTSGEAVLASSVEITVTFRGTGRQAERPAQPESPMWRSTLARMFVNPDQAAEWRLGPSVTRAPGPAPRALTQAGMVKIRVFETAVHKVTAATLISAGFPAGTDVSSLHLFRRGYDDATLQASVIDIAFAVEESAGGVAGEFDGDDLLVFYALGIREDDARGDLIRKYSDYNVYWLGTTAGPTMASKSLPAGFVTADTASASFTTSSHNEVDVFFREDTPPGRGGDFNVANFGTVPGPVDQPFDVGAIKPGTFLELTADLHGDRYKAPRTIRLSLVNSQGTVVLDPFASIPNRNQLLFHASVAAADLVTGTNTFRMERPDGSRTGVEVLLNYVYVTYESLYRARGNTLYFNTASLAGDTSVTVTGLDDTDVWLLDVTDSDAPVRCNPDAGAFVPVGGGFALSFRDNITARKDYVVIDEQRMVAVAVENVVADSPSSIIGGSAESGVDVLVVSHGDFISRMQQWVTYRRAQGYRVLMADVEDVFDEFNNGVPHADAIRRFVRHFFELGDAGALVLVGDSSEDAKTIEDTSGPNFVPTYSWADHVSVLNEDEVVTTDRKFVKLPGPGGTIDDYPDLIVGRIPVANDTELQKVLLKVFAYEKPSASDFWRKRMILVADDAYSEGQSTFGGYQFCYWGNETPFQGGQELVAQVIENSLPAGYEVVRFYLDDYTTAIHTNQPGDCVPKQLAIDYVRGVNGLEGVTPKLMAELGQGATMVAIQSHMNRTLVCHEKLLSTESGSLLGGAGRDHLRMENRGKPYILFALGCHFSDYALHKELSTGRLVNNRPNGDAFGEQLLLANDTGAVGTYGSSGFEYLGQTNAYMLMTARIWFYEDPFNQIEETRGQWIFGQLMYLVETAMAGVQTKPVERYHLLGDPMLHIDAGPPAFDVTVNGADFESGGFVGSGGEGDTIHVNAIVTDENVMHDFTLTIDGVDRTSDLTVTRLVDQQIERSRQYELSFAHKLLPTAYDIVLTAFQAPDTSGGYHMAAEFVLRVESRVSLTVDGRMVESGDIIPPTADYVVELTTPVFIPADSVALTIDDDPVSDKILSHPTPDDSTTWLIQFTRTLTPGPHELVVRAGSGNVFRYNLVVSSTVGLMQVFNYPNPFTDTTTFLYRNEVEISDGHIDIFTVSGKRVRRLAIPPEARQVTSAGRQNAVFWDGRDESGGMLANGVYLFVISVTQRGQSTTTQGKLARIE